MICIENACFSYDNKKIMQDFSLNIPMNGITALCGPSGCGKTTLLRLLAGLEKFESGSVSGITPEKTAFLFQENRLLPWRTVRQHITDVSPRNCKFSPEALLELVELAGEGNAYPDSLSGGMCRRLALARCLALEGELLLLDEPFAGVDPACAERILERLKQAGSPILLVSHQEGVLAMADRCFLLSGTPIACN